MPDQQTTNTPVEPNTTQQPQTQTAQPPAQPGQEPAAVPYERFKEVNEKYKTLETQLKEIQNQQQAAEEKRLKEQNDFKTLFEKTEAELKKERTNNMKMRVASSKGLPVDLVNRIVGETEEDISKDVDNLLAFMKKETPAGGVTPPPKGGNSTGAFDFANATPQQVREHLAKQNQQ
jgi:hypothetical protein